jgi:hypothetical protein
MRIPIALALAASAMVTGAAATVGADDPHVTDAQAKVAERWLAGKEAGEPRNCIMMNQIRGTQFVGEKTILYRISNNLIYRNDPPAGCPGLRENSALISQTPMTQMCRGDVLVVRDLVTGFNGSSCALGAFVPYTPPK